MKSFLILPITILLYGVHFLLEQGFSWELDYLLKQYLVLIVIYGLSAIFYTLGMKKWPDRVHLVVLFLSTMKMAIALAYLFVTVKTVENANHAILHFMLPYLILLFIDAILKRNKLITND